MPHRSEQLINVFDCLQTAIEPVTDIKNIIEAHWSLNRRQVISKGTDITGNGLSFFDLSDFVSPACFVDNAYTVPW